MTKNDLKTGMFGIMDNGFKFVIVDDKFIYQTGEYDDFDHLSDNLELWYKKINKLFIGCYSFNSLDAALEIENSAKCVYDRNKPKDVEMTIPEIEKALGITNLKIIK